MNQNEVNPCMQRMYPQADVRVQDTFSCPEGHTVHAVAQGDTLSKLAAQHKTTVDAILRANPGLTATATLRIGRLLCIPQAVECAGRLHVLKRGDSLYKLALANGLTVDEILRANPGLNPRYYRAGDTICLPVAGGAGEGCPADAVEYVVARGDTWPSIAAQFDASYQTIMQYNPAANLTREPVVGAKLCLPPVGASLPCAGGSRYIIESGMDFAGILETLGVSAEALLAANPMLAPAGFVPGRTVCLPGVQFD